MKEMKASLMSRSGPPFGYCPRSRILVEADMLSNGPSPHTGFLSHVIKAIMEGRAVRKSLDLSPLSSIRK